MSHPEDLEQPTASPAYASSFEQVELPQIAVPDRYPKSRVSCF